MNTDQAIIAAFCGPLFLIIVAWIAVLLLRNQPKHSRTFWWAKRVALVATAALACGPYSPLWDHLSHYAGKQIYCLTNVSVLARGLQQYQADFDNFYPISTQWETAINSFTKTELPFLCLASGGELSGYGFNSYLPQNGNVTDPEHTLLITETSKNGPNALIEKDTDIVSRHLNPNVAFADGRAAILVPQRRYSVILKEGDNRTVRLPPSRFDSESVDHKLAILINRSMPIVVFGLLSSGLVYFLRGPQNESGERRSLRVLVLWLVISVILALVLFLPFMIGKA